MTLVHLFPLGGFDARSPMGEALALPTGKLRALVADRIRTDRGQPGGTAAAGL